MRTAEGTLLALGAVPPGVGDAWAPPVASPRCAWIAADISSHEAGRSRKELLEQYTTVSADANTFYRGTARLFWQDFAPRADNASWGDYDLSEIGIEATLADGSPIQRTSTWTWVTGDQHLSNFGAWRNRHNTIVHGVNDFDEAAIFDFRIDVWRVAVSIWNHALSNGLGDAAAEASVLTFVDGYIAAVQGYVGNDDALLWEATRETTTGRLQKFLKKVAKKDSQAKQLDKFTELDGDGTRHFIMTNASKLGDVDAKTQAKIRAAFSRNLYGATIEKVAWRAKQWNAREFRVVDIAARLGSGVGSFGVDRYYVLLSGVDDLLGEDPTGVILDVKYEPMPAVRAVLDAADAAWYDMLFSNDARRAITGQRALTSYPDPYAGWLLMDGDSYLVRQRSPWKAEFDLNSLKTYAEFAEYVQQIATITATSHVRGTIGNSPGQFKEVIAAAFSQPYARLTLGVSVAKVAAAYREQVLFDYDCFVEYVANFTAAGPHPQH